MTNQVNVLLTTYNQAQFLSQTIASILAQETNFSWNLIISDDGSTDHTHQIVNQFIKAYPSKITLLPPDKNIGRFANLAKLIKVAHAPYLALCAGDDYWPDHHKLQKQFDFLNQHQDYSICFTRYQEIDERKKTQITKPSNLYAYFTSTMNRTNFLKRWQLASSSIFMRRDALRNFPYSQYQYLEDTHLVYYALQSGKGKTLNFVGTVYRIHQKNVYANQDELTQMIINQKVFKDLYQQFPHDLVLGKRFNLLTFAIARNFYTHQKVQEAKNYLQQLTNLSPGFFLNFPFRFYSISQRLIKNYQNNHL